jgi:hypothetical protein
VLAAYVPLSALAFFLMRPAKAAMLVVLEQSGRGPARWCAERPLANTSPLNVHKSRLGFEYLGRSRSIGWLDLAGNRPSQRTDVGLAQDLQVVRGYIMNDHLICQFAPTLIGLYLHPTRCWLSGGANDKESTRQTGWR